jgi:hypothetical protein
MEQFFFSRYLTASALPSGSTTLPTNSVDISACYGLDGLWFKPRLGARDFLFPKPVQTDHEINTASCTLGNRSLSLA